MPRRTTTEGFSIEFEGRAREFLVARAPPSTSSPRLNELVVVLHPFHGTPEKTKGRFAHLLEVGFDLILPAGIDNSWNAGECCGEAKRLGLHDAEFVSEVVQAYFSNTQHQVRAFVVGYSNGGFLTTRVLLRAATGMDSRFGWVRGGVSIAGEIFDAEEYRIRNESFPVPVMIIHSHGDEVVFYDGCCPSTTTPTKSCCCDIFSPVCSSTDDAFARWRTVNRCAGDDGSNHVKSLRTNSTTCQVALGCSATTVLCSFQNELHRGSPRILRQMTDFLCGLSGKCMHDVDWNTVGGKGELSDVVIVAEDTVAFQQQMDWTGVVESMFVLALLGVMIWVRWFARYSKI